MSGVSARREDRIPKPPTTSVAGPFETTSASGRGGMTVLDVSPLRTRTGAFPGAQPARPTEPRPIRQALEGRDRRAYDEVWGPCSRHGPRAPRVRRRGDRPTPVGTLAGGSWHVQTHPGCWDAVDKLHAPGASWGADSLVSGRRPPGGSWAGGYRALTAAASLSAEAREGNYHRPAVAHCDRLVRLGGRRAAYNPRLRANHPAIILLARALRGILLAAKLIVSAATARQFASYRGPTRGSNDFNFEQTAERREHWHASGDAEYAMSFQKVTNSGVRLAAAMIITRRRTSREVAVEGDSLR